VAPLSQNYANYKDILQEIEGKKVYEKEYFLFDFFL